MRVVSSTRLRINPFSGVLRADTPTDPSPRLCYVTSASSLRRRSVTSTTPLRRRSVTSPSPLQPRCVAAPSLLRRRCNPAASLLRHFSVAAATPLRYPCGEIHSAAAMSPVIRKSEGLCLRFLFFRPFPPKCLQLTSERGASYIAPLNTPPAIGGGVFNPADN